LNVAEEFVIHIQFGFYFLQGFFQAWDLFVPRSLAYFKLLLLVDFLLALVLHFISLVAIHFADFNLIHHNFSPFGFLTIHLVHSFQHFHLPFDFRHLK